MTPRLLESTVGIAFVRGMPMKAVEFEQRYGDLARAEYSHCTSAHTLAKALEGRQPQVIVSRSALQVWFHNYSAPTDAVRVSSVEELERVCGSDLPAMAAQHGTEHKLWEALKARTPSVYVGCKILRVWLRKHMQLERIHSAGLSFHFPSVYPLHPSRTHPSTPIC